MPLLPQSLLYNRYRILAELGRGGMGAVYHGTDENLNVDVAIKENLFVSPEFAQQFRREASLLAGLRHSNMPRVTDHFVIPGQGQYLVMDFIAGTDAGRRQKQAGGPLPEAAVLGWGSDILDALAYLHSRQPPVVHRDLKPGNIKITPEGRAMLVDFGLAKAQDSGQATATGAKGRSPGYSPPEQYGSGRTTHRSDLYSLGATLYALLAGQPPADSLERALGQKTLIPLRLLNPEVSEPAAAAIERALAVKPDQRFASAAEFKAALPSDDRTVRPAHPIAAKLPARPAAPPKPAPPAIIVKPAGLPPAAPPPGPIQPAAAPAARPRGRGWLLAVIAVALILVLLIAAGGGAGLLAIGLFNRRPTATPVPTLSPLASATIVSVVAVDTATPLPRLSPTAVASAAAAQTEAATATSVVNSGATEDPSPTTLPTPAVTPIGAGAGQIAFVSERTGRPQIFLMNADGSQPAQLTNEAEGACQPAWSPDGQQLVFVTPCTGKHDSYPGSAIYIINTDGSGVRPFMTILGGAYDPDWSVAGLVFTHPVANRPQIYIVNPDGVSAHGISSANSGDSQPASSPDGKMLAFTNFTRSGRSTIYWMFRDGAFLRGGSNPEAVTRDVDAVSAAWSPDGRFVIFVSQGQIMVAEWDKRGFGLTTLSSVGPNADPAWSPDSLWIVFESWRDAANHDIYRLTFAGGQLTRLTDDPGLDYQPAWRP